MVSLNKTVSVMFAPHSPMPILILTLQQLKLGHVFVRREFEEEDEDISVTPRDNRHGWFHARFGRF